MCVAQSDAQLAQYLIREALGEIDGWSAGVGVSVSDLAELIDEWDDDEAEEFEAAIESLDEAGWLVLEEDACGEGGVLYCGRQ